MTQFIEPNKKSDLVAARVLDWLQSLRTGLLSGFSVAYNSGFNVDVGSGRVIIGGTSIHDDATRLNQSFGLGTNANAQHVMLWVKYTATDTFPPAAMTLGATVAVGASPTAGPASPPTLPADSVKISDIFIPGGATDLSTATIINAPPLPARGNADGDVLLERLVASNANIAVTGGGGFDIVAGAPYTLSWTAAIDIAAPTITHREKYGTASMVHARIPLNAGLVNVPANAVLFTHVDRRAPNTYAAPDAAVMKFIDLDAPTPAQMTDFAPSDNRDKVIIIGRVTGGVLSMTGNLGALPVPTTEPPPRFLGMDPGGDHTWDPVNDTDLIGGLMSVADTTARDLIPGPQVKEGMVVYLQDVDRHQVREGGMWVELGDDNRLVGGLQTVANTADRDAIPAAKIKEGMVVYAQDIDRHFVREGGMWVELGDDNRLVGGLQTVANTAARDAIPAAKIKEGMIVYAQDIDRHFVREGGVWVELGDDGRLVGGLRVVSDLTTIPLANQKVDMVVMLSTTNVVYRLNATSAPPIPAGNWRKLFTASGVSDTVSAIEVDQLRIVDVDLKKNEAEQLYGTTPQTPRNLLLRGGYLSPSVSISFSALEDNGASANLSPGAMRMANGRLCIWDTEIKKVLSRSDTPGVASSDINNVVPVFNGNTPWYFYIRFKIGDVNPIVVHTVDPPDALGRPQATAQAGFTVDDYAYVGMLIPKTIYAFNATPPPTKEYQSQFWEGCYVEQVGSYRRVHWSWNQGPSPSLGYDTTAFIGTIAAGAAGPQSALISSAVVLDAAHMTTPDGVFCRAKKVAVNVSYLMVNAETGAGGTINYRTYAPGYFDHDTIQGSGTGFDRKKSYVVEAPVQAGASGVEPCRLRIQREAYAGGFTPAATSIVEDARAVVWVEEDINDFTTNNASLGQEG